MAQQIKKERLPLQSVLFSLNMVMDVFSALAEIKKFHTEIGGMNLPMIETT